MTSILAISLLIRIAAFGWSLVVWRRVKDWRLGVITFLILLMALRQALTVYGTSELPFLSGIEGAAELPGLAVSVGILIVVVLMGRLVQGSQRSAKNLMAANAQLRDQIAAREQAQQRLPRADGIRTVRFHKQQENHLRPDHPSRRSRVGLARRPGGDYGVASLPSQLPDSHGERRGKKGLGTGISRFRRRRAVSRGLHH